MKQLKHVIQSLISISEIELNDFLKFATTKTFKRQEIFCNPGEIPHELYFIEKGITRTIITDKTGTDHTLHFALENQFIVDYSSFILQKPSVYTIQALEETRVVVLPREAIEWGCSQLKEGQKLGRIIAENYFIYQDERIKNGYSQSPKERYDAITAVFPNIHNRVPQHMIASYIGISSVHLSRLKK